MIGRVRILGAVLRNHLRAHPWLSLAVVAVAVTAGVWAARSRRGTDPDLAASREALERRDFPGAYAHLETCLRRRPNDPDILFLAARTARRATRYDCAQTHLTACRRIEGASDRVTLERALLRGARGDAEVEPYLKARADGGHPDTLLIWEVLIQLYLDNYQLFQARDYLDRYLERRPDDVRALLGRGYIWERLFAYAEAVRDYGRAVQVEPENDRARLQLAESLLITGPAAEAAVHFERLRQRHPDSLPARLGLARAWRHEGRTEQARRLLDTLLAERPSDAALLSERGLVALDEGDTTRAVAWLRRAVERAPFDREALHNLWQCLTREGRSEEARACRARLDRIDADLKRLGVLTKAVLRTPQDPGPRCEVGVLFLRTGQEQEGVRWLNKVLRLHPGYRPAHRALADYYQRAGQPEQAEYHRRLAETPKSAR